MLHIVLESLLRSSAILLFESEIFSLRYLTIDSSALSLLFLNIVIGISVAFFTNYLILQLGQSDSEFAQSMRFGEWNWRWMLGLETLPAVLYFFALFAVPESPRWQIMKGLEAPALKTLTTIGGEVQAKNDIEVVKESLSKKKEKVSVKELFVPTMKAVLTIGIVVAVLQQITGINSVFFYAPMIFEQSGIGTDASFIQAILVGLTNLVFTVAAIMMIDRFGRKPLLVFGVSGIVVCMLLLAYGFNEATYTLSEDKITEFPENIQEGLSPLVGQTFDSDVEFKNAVKQAIGKTDALEYESSIITASISANPTLILFGILGFVASFAISIGPVMWVLFSELFPNRIRGLAISFVGLINSGVSFLVQLVFPWELATFGSSLTFFIYGMFAVLGLIFILLKVPETKGKSLEELEKQLVR